MSKITRHMAALATAIAAALPVAVQAAPTGSIKASLDSTTLEMGRVTRLRLDIVVPENAPGVLLVKPRAALTEGIEVADIPPADTARLGNGLMEIKQDIVIQSFDSGEYVIPEIRYLSGSDTLASGPVSLKVYPVDVSQMETINPDADIEKGDSKWYDFLPDFVIDYWEWILLFLIAVPLIVWLIVRFRKKGLSMPFKAPAPKLSPYEIAMRDLTLLKDRNLCASGQEKEFYTGLTDILRVYLQQRFGINAMEMTSTQITRILADNEETRVPNRLMRQILEIADFVKFAKVRPMPDDNVRAFNSAMQFVEDTRPADPPATGDTGDNHVKTNTGH